jgi:small subunit ribosomal protein S18
VAYDRNDRDSRGDRDQRGGRGGRKGRKKVCSFCVDKVFDIDYKDVPRLRRYLSERAKIIPRRVTGTCAQHQRQLTVAIKRARHVALLPFITD